MDSLREIQRGLIQDIRTISNLQGNTSNNNNSRNRTFTTNTGSASNTRRAYYSNNGGLYYVDGRPFRFDFYSNQGQTSENFADALWNNFENLYSNIVVRPTQETIQNSTRNIVYSQVINPLNSNCPISLEPFDDSSEVTQIRGCGHIFHTDSLNIWFERNVRCPVCRYDIRNPVNAQEHSNQESSTAENSQASAATNVEANISEPNATNNEFEQGLTNLTETILNRLLNPGIAHSRRNSVSLNRENTRVLYDPSNNEIVFQGFY
jgi:hypothetical protein